MLTCAVSMEDRTFTDEKSGVVRPYTAFLLTLPNGIEIRIKTADSTAKDLLIKAIREKGKN